MTSLPRRFWQDARAVFASPIGLTGGDSVYRRGATGAWRSCRGTRRRRLPGAGRAGQAADGPPRGVPEVLGVAAARAGARARRTGPSVLIVKFSDYQCPSCAQSYLDYKPILAKYAAQFPGAMKLS